MRTKQAERINVQRRISNKTLSTLTGVLIVGLAAPLHAQTCNPVEAAKLLPADGAATDVFGTSVSISGNTAVVGMPYDDDYGSNSGSAYIFTRTGSVWTQMAKLLPLGYGNGINFGASVSISGNTVVVGVPYDNTNGINSGSAYVFAGTEGVWTLQGILMSIGGDFAQDNWFGSSVSINGDTIIIGASGDNDTGSANVFTRTSGIWTPQVKLFAADGTAGDNFGSSVSNDGNTAIIGAVWDDDNGTDSGSAYVFTHTGGVWTQQAKLLAADGGSGDQFGGSVSISNGTILIGTSSADSAYIFTHTGGVWTQQAKLIASDGGNGDQFGGSVSINNDTIIIGSRRNDNNQPNSGSAYIFTRIGNTWTQQSKLLPAEQAANDYFGNAVSISGNSVAIGEFGDDDNGNNSGSAYIFDLGCSNCPADLTGDGMLNFFDVSAFLNAFAANDPIADFTGDGNFNFFDVSAFLSAFSAGCP